MRVVGQVALLGSAGVDLNFYVRRALRIFPLYYGVLLALFVLLRLQGASEAVVALRQAEPWAWLYVMNFFVGINHVHTYIDHFWSLAVEEHFYLVWPLLVWALRHRLNALLLTSVVIAVASRSARIVAELNGINEFAASWFTPFRLDALCFGAAIAVMARRPEGVRSLIRWLPALVAIGGVVFASALALRYLGSDPPSIIEPADSVGLVLLFGALIIASIAPNRGRLLTGLVTNRPMRMLGKYSYGIYVFHAPIARYLWIRQPDAWLAERIGSPLLALLLQAVVASAVSIGIAVMSYELYERRFLALKARFAPHSSPVVLTARPGLPSS
jgi:peptidoglycan/LPS O-acetylase OafA/YrhL